MNWLPTDKVIIQGINEHRAAWYAMQMKAYGTEIVAGVSPGNGGIKVEEVPVFDSVEQVIEQVAKIDVSLIFVEPYQVLDSAREAIAAGIRRLIVLTSGVPPLDAIELVKHAREHDTLVLGPGSSGIIIPRQVCLGSLESEFYLPGTVGLITSSRHLGYEVAAELNGANLGQSLVVSLGNEPIIGSNLAHWLSVLSEDPNTEAIVSIGQKIGSIKEIIDFSKNRGYNKPVIIYLAGLNAPQEKTYRDALTIISNHLSASIPAVNRDRQTIDRLQKLGMKIVQKPSEIPSIVQQALSPA